ncbi:prolyl-tRNA synthetase [Allocatelliglobosispora scoriae]|uniref:Proline--tRNA ligase n=1 Tax=Allocatelliglobosispora scoriae TaxID=643052 RepID=A0A841BJ66_9ACTN|nr:proline--tRNA ligase [Allocatelliglobosispora scoriae]MBB5869157.1 prolyl-tRNA synthetase [Allocatelliglobosispora scoriae]
MRWSSLFIPTLRQEPAGAEAVSHRLLLRAGFIRQLAAGHYSLLPLAVRVRAKIIEVIREEMSEIGAQEFLLPAMHPAEIWRKSGRWDVMGEEMFRLMDRRGAELALGMTHEEIFTTVAGELRSYRDLPQLWYQFQTKFRDEPRPKSGLIRVREFTMKDSYSFDLDAAGLDRSFDLHHAAYRRIFARLGIPAIPVQASNGTMGGSDSVEFMCPCDAGEDIVVRCPNCGYAANMEKAVALLPDVDDGDGVDAELSRFATPGVRTIDDLDREFGVTADRQIKTLVYVADGELVLVLLRGDHALIEQKLIDALGAIAIRPAHAEEIHSALGANPGSLGAVGVTDLPVIADESLRHRRGMTTGANADGFHLSGVDVGRDIVVGRWADLRQIAAGETCLTCGDELELIRTVEVGHIFKLGYKFTETLGVSVLGPDGQLVAPIMGSYGIGVERALAAIVECHHDDDGIVWPASVAPFAVAIVPAGTDEAVTEAAERIYGELRRAGVEVVLDDRAERPGVKFRDVELVGIPLRVTVGARGLAQGTVELTDRTTRETRVIRVEDVLASVLP